MQTERKAIPLGSIEPADMKKLGQFFLFFEPFNPSRNDFVSLLKQSTRNDKQKRNRSSRLKLQYNQRKKTNND